MQVSKGDILDFRYISIAAFLLLTPASSGAQAQPGAPDEAKIWTTIGSAGTLDKNDISKVFFDHSTVQAGITLGGTQSPPRNPALPVQTESAVIRYNITPVDGLFPLPVGAPGTAGVQMTVRYLAARAQVVANLIEVDLKTGGETVRLTFDSNSPDFHHSDDYHVDQVGQCQPPWSFDFNITKPDPNPNTWLGKAYYIETTLTHNPIAVGSAAGIQMIKVSTNFCPG
jgi:hypothetical protein